MQNTTKESKKANKTEREKAKVSESKRIGKVQKSQRKRHSESYKVRSRGTKAIWQRHEELVGIYTQGW